MTTFKTARLPACVGSDGEWRRGMRIIGPERMALNPDCGFAPNSAEPPSIDEAYEKLRGLVAAAAQLRAAHSLSLGRDHNL